MYIGPWQELKLAHFREQAVFQFREEWKKQQSLVLSGASSESQSALDALISSLEGTEQHVSLRDLRGHYHGEQQARRAMITRSLGGAEADSSTDGSAAGCSAASEGCERRTMFRSGEQLGLAGRQLLWEGASESSGGREQSLPAGSRTLQAAAAAEEEWYAITGGRGDTRGAEGWLAAGSAGDSPSSAVAPDHRAHGTDSKRVAAMLRVCRRADNATRPPAKAVSGAAHRELSGTARVQRMKQVYRRGMAAPGTAAHAGPPVAAAALTSTAAAEGLEAASAARSLGHSRLNVRYTLGPSGPVAYRVHDRSVDAISDVDFRGWTPVNGESASREFTSLVSDQMEGISCAAQSTPARHNAASGDDATNDDDASSAGSVDEIDVEKLLAWTELIPD